MPRYAQVGLGIRSWLYSIAIVNHHPEGNALVGLCERNAGRLRQRQEWARANGLDVPVYAPEDFDRMLVETQADAVIVTTDDVHHDHYIVRAMERGCDVVTEKPLTIDAERCGRILDARSRTGRRLIMAFNYRYAPPRMQVKRLLGEGAIGDVVSVDFHWLLDTTHGADYFRRWHRRKECSGGLLVHKATHHFDLVNWWLGTRPARVFASGRRVFYTPETAGRLGLAGRGERCRGCPVAARCAFHLDLEARGELKMTYLDHEHHDGYLRDRCVFAEEIDIEDAVSAVVEYESGARLSYSLHAFAPWEGYTVAFNGTRGRLEHRMEETSYASGDGTVPGAMREGGSWIRLLVHGEPPREVPLETGEGGHGGGDHKLAEALFGPAPGDDPLGLRADHLAGAWAALTGIAANRSIATGRPADVVLPGPPARLR
jgi:predicted dehydrogenase